MESGLCFFNEGITSCQLCCNNCLSGCKFRCMGYKNCCGGYIGSKQYWGSWEERQLLQLRRASSDWSTIADVLGRSILSCKLKWKRKYENNKENLS